MNIINEKLPWSEVCQAYSEGKLGIGADRHYAITAKGLGLISSRTSKFLIYLSYITFITSIVCSFIFAWWCFILGFFCFGYLINSATSADAKALRKAVLSNNKLYDYAFDHNWITVYDISGYMNSEEHINLRYNKL